MFPGLFNIRNPIHSPPILFLFPPVHLSFEASQCVLGSKIKVVVGTMNPGQSHQSKVPQAPTLLTQRVTPLIGWVVLSSCSYFEISPRAMLLWVHRLWVSWKCNTGERALVTMVHELWINWSKFPTTVLKADGVFPWDNRGRRSGGGGNKGEGGLCESAASADPNNLRSQLISETSQLSFCNISGVWRNPSSSTMSLEILVLLWHLPSYQPELLQLQQSTGPYNWL